MKRTLFVVAAVVSVLILSGCSDPKTKKEEHIKAVKARIFDTERKISRMEKAAEKMMAGTKGEKARAAEMKKVIASAKNDLAVLVEIADKLEAAAESSWDSLADALERGTNALSDNVDRMLITYKENQQQ